MAPTAKRLVTLSQQLFPSSSPSASAGCKGSALASNPSAANIQPQGGAKSNPLKRTAMEANLPVTKAHQGSRPAISQSSHNSSSGLVNLLHSNVSFDENDFVDDNDIDIDADFEISLPSKRTCTTTALPPPPRPTTTSLQPPSSVPIPWSSSPLGHKLPVPLPQAPAQQNATKDEAGIEYPELGGANDKQAAKWRTLPWLQAQEDQKTETSKQRGRPKGSRSKGTPAVGDAAETPAKNAKQDPWNMSASAIKAEHQKHRQKANQGKKRMKEMDGAPSNKKGKKKGAQPIVLSEEQSRVLALVTEAKRSVFFTGSAGTGKSVLMREIIRSLKNKYAKEQDRIAVTASTGLAACNIGGVTLHSFAGIGLGKEPAEALVKKIKRQAKSKNRWMRAKVLIIDEVSMIDGELFDKLEQVARMIRGNGRPFGGIQLVVTGDFFQLPPVPDRDPKRSNQDRDVKFAFEAGTWSTSIDFTIGLTQIFRQRDPEFAAMLNEMRVGRLSKASTDVFKSLCRPLPNIKGDDIEVQATELFPTRAEVDNANRSRLQKLPGNEMVFNATDGGALDPEYRGKALAACMAPEAITLKKGAQVMLIKNLDEQLVNGSIGQVIGFTDEATFDKSHNAGDDIPSSGIPTGDLSEDEADTASVSRARLRAMMYRDNPSGASTSQKWPVVAFPLAGGGQRDYFAVRESWKIEQPNGEIQASRMQVPLILAWALSIHKAQGQTLESVKVDLGRTFEKGQAYVALSRATSKEGLQVLRFDPSKVMAHPKVRAFYDSLYGVDKAEGVGAAGASARGLQKKMGLDRVEYPDLSNYGTSVSFGAKAGHAMPGAFDEDYGDEDYA